MKRFFLVSIITIFIGCSKKNIAEDPTIPSEEDSVAFDFSNILNINFNTLLNYNEQYIPAYITKDNTPNANTITNGIATLGRVLFYDKKLSVNNTVSCASCHKQELAFGDDNTLSTGVNGLTNRHSMRLVNIRFSNENKFFWDKRVNTLETQISIPIQDHIEMGFSGENGSPNFDDLIVKLENTEYYPDLFNFAFGNELISELRIQNALSQFIRSIQSFDSKYDEGRTLAAGEIEPFNNFTAEENLGKQLFLEPAIFNNQGSRITGGLSCFSCHQAPEFNIDPNSLNNGVIGNANGPGTDLTITRSPTLRDVIKTNGTSNGQFMHMGISNTIATVLNHYNAINPEGNNNLDPRLNPSGNGQQLNITQTEKDAVIAFLRTLAGSAIYTSEKWSDPFIN